MLRLKTWVATMGMLFVETFVLCVLWNVVEPNTAYIHMLETVFPGFKWLSAGSVVLGALESFAYGAYLAGSFVLIHNFLYRRHEHQQHALKRNVRAA